MVRKILFIFLSIVLFNSCIEIKNPYNLVPPGKWRGELKVGTSNTIVYREEDHDRNKNNRKNKVKNDAIGVRYENVDDGILPFNFEVSYDKNDSLIFTFINGDEKVVVEDVRTWREPSTGYDSIQINFVEYGNFIKGSFKGNVIEGEWVVPSKDNYKVPFVAHFGKNYRFSDHKAPSFGDFDGNWGVVFNPDSDNEKAIGEFHQNDNILTGTFITETGDYRYLSGEVYKDKMYLSAFDGAHAILCVAKKLENGNLSGFLSFGHKYKAIWEGKKKLQELEDPNEMTIVDDVNVPLIVNLEDINGDLIDVTSASKGKVQIIQIMGTWCPNCKDESNFFSELLKDDRFRDINIVGLSFERSNDFLVEQTKVDSYASFMKIPYQLYYAGKANKDVVASVLPQMSKIRSYPTMIIIDKKGMVRKIHTGFSGPATSKYLKFKENFISFLLNLIKE